MPLTLEDIARMSGVSRSTVSRVINADPNVNEQTRIKVQSIIRSIDFQPNLAARGLEMGGQNCLSYPDAVREVHEAYVAAGCEVLTTNTLTMNRIYIESHGVGVDVRAVNLAGVRLAREVAAVACAENIPLPFEDPTRAAEQVARAATWTYPSRAANRTGWKSCAPSRHPVLKALPPKRYQRRLKTLPQPARRTDARPVKGQTGFPARALPIPAPSRFQAGLFERK